jgi:Tfp pilus assembly major pilin PilA
MRKYQQGMTFIGLLCVLALAGVVVYAGIRLAPLYLNYMKIARTMEAVATEVKGDNPDPANMRMLIDRHFNIEDPTAVTAKDIEITKDDGGVQMHVAYDDSVPYVANVSLMVHFDKTVKVR